MPAGSKTDSPLAKAEPISHGGSASGITQLRRGVGGQEPALHQEQLKLERRVSICNRNSSADTKVSEVVGGGGAPGAGVEIPLQPMEKTMLRQTEEGSDRAALVGT
ncbi:junction-mediating and -regulatory protein-like [Grus japonensis]|uniref:Junction-mediating and -regulatory protein-like n=1 Tax=Grus japonensis TaxID=30415 RepID=A0ABC9W583_GRUJA